MFVRKVAKEYGTCRFVEGTDVRGRNVSIIEDVVTTGGAAIAAVANLREAGAIVESILYVIERDPVGGSNLRAVDVEPISLFSLGELSRIDG